jgi:hypothetical protein
MLGLSLLGLLPWSSACVSEESASGIPAPARVELIRVDTLSDPDGRLLGRFSNVMVGSDSSVYVPIQYENHVLQFDKRGRLLRRIGRHGSGPGEFSGAPRDIVEWGDSLVFASLSGRTVSFFSKASGEYYHREAVDGFPFTIAATPTHLFASVLSATRGTAAGVWVAGSDSMQPIIPIPASVRQHPLGMQRWPVSLVTAVGDTAIVGFVTSNELLVATASGRVVDSLRIPALRRRAIPSNLDEVLKPLIGGRLAAFLFATQMSLTQRPDSYLLAMHVEWTTTDSTNRPFVDGERVTETHQTYATLIDRRRRRACVDTPIHTNWTTVPAMTAHDNDIVVVGHVESDEERSVVEMRRYRIDISTCNWVPLT